MTWARFCTFFAACVVLWSGVGTAWAEDDATAEADPPAGVEDHLAPVTRDRLFRRAKVGLHVVDVETGREVFGSHAEDPLLPASTMKVLTSAAALRTLGPSYRFTTDVYTDGELDAAGVLRGNLYIRGHGDPTLVIEKLWKMVYDLKVLGIERITGDVVFDETFFDGRYQLPGWDKKDDVERGPAYFATISALSVNFNTVAVVVAPGVEIDGPARVVLETPTVGYVEIDNQLVTTAEGGPRWVKLTREVERGSVKFVVEGQIPADDDAKKYYRTVPDPTAHFIAVWRHLEQMHGIKVGGKHRRGAVPIAAEALLQLRSPPLSVVLMDMNKYSNNFMAEQVLRTMGAEVHGAPGSTANGLKVIDDYLEDLGIDDSEHVLINGSGLSRKGGVKASHLTAVLVDMASDPEVGHEFNASLAISGRDGTLWSRLPEDPGRVRGKTGTIDGVHCLAGYVRADDGRTYAFAFLVNGFRGGTSPVKRLHDRFLHRMFEVDATTLPLEPLRAQ